MLFSIISFFPRIVLFMKCVEIYGRAKQATYENITRRMRFACWITKATDTHSEYPMLTAFIRQHWLCICDSLLHCYVHCLSYLLSNYYVHFLWITVGIKSQNRNLNTCLVELLLTTCEFLQCRPLFVLLLLHVCCFLSFPERTDQLFESWIPGWSSF